MGTECTSIPANSFSSCNNLEELTLPFIGLTPTSTGIEATLGVLFGTSSGTGLQAVQQYYNATQSKTYYIPTSLKKLTITRPATQIGYGALYNCTMLKEVTIPSTVRGVGEKALYGCSGLEHIYSHWANPPAAYANSTFDGVNKFGCILHVPVGSKIKYSHEQAKGWNEFFDIQEEAAVTIVARPVPLYGGIIGGNLQYNYDATASITASGNMGYDFQAWMENESIVSTSREYSFMVEGPRTLYAIFTPRENENSVSVSTPTPTEAVISWDGETGASSYTLIVYSDAARTQEYARFEFNANGTLRANESRLSYTLNNLTAGQRYYYSVTAYDNENYKLSIANGNFDAGNTGIVETDNYPSLQVAGYYGIMGQKLSKEPEKGIYIILYETGKTVKVLK